MNSVVLWSDIGCPWASLAVHRLLAARSRLALDDAVVIDHRAFPLELVNGRASPKRVLDPEIAVIGAHQPDLGWQVWQRPDAEWVVSTLLALEAVQAAKAPEVGGLKASEQLDAALRRAVYVDSRYITLHTVILEVAAECEAISVAALEHALTTGRAREALFEQARESAGPGVQGSPHLFLPDGTGHHNPGITVGWSAELGRGFPVIEADDPAVYDDLLWRAAA